ncbi:MAG: dTMP kinase [candidate division KSB1 bacterium]|nr:dTMP kinase [candidate division KSB1 bacterium]MDZ7273284.1 dTMP kinase [candidate division KSB1 bacterium]MDZ7285386.1 dTMP kinase [candidate division KSB1 bacterium]MDZ7298418.1 dTMP kinase [candidate division KSB1 bacterium]MDZ7307683.1 dTMP kinase [candidate division KSB1 bacterium]
MSGLFISFEGIDGSGKSEQSRRLVDRLRQAGYSGVEFVREPGGVEIAEAIRRILLDTRHHGLHDRTELLLYSAARAQITSERILPALAAGRIVVADRYVDSTTVYQGHGRGLDPDFVRAVNHFATQGLLPHLTFLLDVPVEVAQARQQHNGLTKDRLESENEAFHRRVRQAYLQLAAAEAQRFVIIDGAQSLAAISAEVAQHLRQRLDLRV